MAVNLSPIGGVAGQFFDNNGNPLSGGKIFTYAAGTTTNQATYTSATGVTAHTNPIILDAAGRVPGGEIWLTDGLSYKFVIKTSTDVLIGTYDNIVGINSNFINFLTETEIQTATAGQTVFTLTTMQYQPNTNSLSVFVDGVNQYDGVTYAYVETDSVTVTFTAGLHVGALVKFTTAQTLSSGVTDASLVTYDPPFTGSVPTNVEEKLSEIVSVKDFGAAGDGVTDDTAAIQAAINAVGTNLGGTITFPSGTFKISATLTIPYSNVVLMGNGSGSSHDVVSQTASTATRLLWDGAVGGTMVSVYSPSGAGNIKLTGCGISQIMFDSNISSSGAAIGLEIKSQNCGQYSQLFFLEFSTACVSMDVVATLGEAKDPQQNIFDTIICRQFLTTGSCFVFSGDSVSNTSMNLFQNIDLAIYNGNGFVFNNSDNNVFIRTRVIAAAGGTGTSVLFNGSNAAAGQVARNNSFLYHSANTPAVGKGTTSFTYASYDNSLYYLDTDNSTPVPVIETSSSVAYSNINNTQFKLKSIQAVLVDQFGFLAAQQALLTNETLRIFNNSDAHISLVAAAALWGINIQNSTGNLRITAGTGAGALVLPDANGSALVFGSRAVNVGAPDSGGVGFRILRVPN